jgi:hypothetical protein
VTQPNKILQSNLPGITIGDYRDTQPGPPNVPPPDGWVWTANGAGGASFQPANGQGVGAAVLFVQGTRPANPPIPSIWFQTDAEGNLTGHSETFTPDAGGPTLPPAIVTPPAVTPSPAFVGNLLSCTTGIWAEYPASYAYQWLSAGVPILGATSSTYTVQAGDVGQALACAVTATNALGSATATSNAVVPTVLPTPQSIFGADLLALYDATQLAGAPGASLGDWPDLTGNGHDLIQAGPGNQPHIATAAEDGLKVVNFDSAGSQSMANTIAGTAQPVTVVIVFKPVTAASPMTAMGLFKCGSSGGAPVSGEQVDSNTNGQYSVAALGPGAIIPNASIPLAGTPYHLWAFVINGINSIITEDNTNAGGANTGDLGANSNLNGFVLGEDSVARFGKLNVRALALIKRAATHTDLANLVLYSQQTWATP